MFSIYNILLLISLILGYISYTFYLKTQNFVQEGTVTTAIVTDLIASRNSDDDGYTYAPVFEYEDENGEKISHQHSISSSPASYSINQKVPIICLEGSYKVLSFWGLYRVTIILLMIASPLFVVGFGHALYIYK